MASFNSCTFVGRLGKDPELRYTQSGKAVCNFNIAVDDGYGDKKETMWLRVSCWDKTADNAAKYLEKGSPVLVSGRLSIRKSEGRDGKEYTNVELTAYNVVFLSSGDRKAAGERDEPREGDNHRRVDPPPRSNKTGFQGPDSGRSAPPVEDDDIPF